MKNLPSSKSILCLILFNSLFFYSPAQNIIKLKGNHPPIVCYGEHNENIQSRIESPFRQNNGARVKSANIQVTYSGFPTNAKTAFEFAVSIWEGLITSDVTIRVFAQWTPLQTGVLGSAGPTYWASNFTGAPNYNVYYPAALAEKLARTSLNATTDYDIFAQFSSEANWYFQSTGTPGATQHDFITVVLHELGHGLGFTSTFSFEGGTGLYGAYTDGVPFPYDVLIQNGSSQNLYTSFDSPSTSMGGQLTSSNLFLNSPSNASPIKIYAPVSFNQGSSIAHVDAATFPQGNANSLMRPFINTQEVNHDPGPIVQNIFKDLGWVTTFINHTHLKNQESLSTPLVVKAIVTADNTPGYSFNTNEVYLVYTSSNNPGVQNELQMTPTGTANEFAATIPAPGSPTTFTYFIRVKDSFNRTILNPGKVYSPLEALASKGPVDGQYSFFAGADLTPPVIDHTPKTFLSYLDTELVVDAVIKEGSDLSSVEFEYIYNNSIPAKSSMTFLGKVQDPFDGGTLFYYRKTIPFTAGQLQDGDEVKYRITAKDNSANKNQAANPESDYILVPVEGLAPSRSYYVNNFNSPSDDFIGSDFSITTPAGFDDPAIHSEHPYPAAGNADALELTYQLRVPIIIKGEESLMIFDEIVLAEPGENGTTYLDEEFYDYVIVEGSKDGGVTWAPVLSGYDSRDYSPWLTRYNGTGEGDPALFRKRTINLRNTFLEGDEVIFRFRIHSDPFASGWGWCIDNLQIQVDDVPPQIQHVHYDYAKEGTASLTLATIVTDELQLGDLILAYKVNSQSEQTEQTTLDETEAFSNFLLDISSLNTGDVVYYKFTATDSAGNVTNLPADGYFAVPIVPFDETVLQYVNDFNTSGTDFIGNFFSITTATGFSNAAIHSQHSYNAGFGTNFISDFSYTLKKKIKINAANPYVQFDEVCLVEGHESSAVFGSSSFNDFVIVEASGDEGLTWQMLGDGYDLTQQASWVTASANKLNGSSSLFKRKTLSLLDADNLNAGDSVLIRFRLYSNESITGWGWAIDNLHIQDVVTGLESPDHLIDLTVSPNPVTGNTVSVVFSNVSAKNISINIMNAQGILFTKEQVESTDSLNKVTYRKDVSNYSNGLYIVNVTMDGKSVMRKFVLNR